MKEHDFNTVIDRKKTSCSKWDGYKNRFGTSEDDVLPMWVADMDFRAPECVVEAIMERAAHGIYGYPIETDSYYDAIVNWMFRRHGWSVKKEWIAYSAGVVPALSTIIRAFTNPGDGVVLQPPVYPPFYEVIENNGCRILRNPLKIEKGKYTIDFDDLEDKVSDYRTKLLLLCSPHNPVGRVWTKEELLKVGRICMDNDVMVVADEIHSDIIYSGNEHIPFPSLSEEISLNSIACISPSKTFNVAGLQSSSIIIPNHRHYNTYFGALQTMRVRKNNIFGLTAAEAAYSGGEKWLEALISYLDDNISFLEDFLAARLPGVKMFKPEATFLVWLDFRSLGMDPLELADFLINKAKVALNPGYWFGKEGEGFARINVGCPRAILEKGLTRIADALEAL